MSSLRYDGAWPRALWATQILNSVLEFQGLVSAVKPTQEEYHLFCSILNQLGVCNETGGVWSQVAPL